MIFRYIDMSKYNKRRLNRASFYYDLILIPCKLYPWALAPFDDHP